MLFAGKEASFEVIMKIVFVLTAIAGCLVRSITLKVVHEGKI